MRLGCVHYAFGLMALVDAATCDVNEESGDESKVAAAARLRRWRWKSSAAELPYPIDLALTPARNLGESPGLSLSGQKHVVLASAPPAVALWSKH